MNLKKLLLTSVLGLSTAGFALAGTEDVKVNVDVNGEVGTIVLTKTVDGASETFEQSFTPGPDTDVQELVDAMMAEHGINMDGQNIHKEVIKNVGNADHKMVWVQKNNDVNVDLVDGQAHVIIKKDNNGVVEVIEESFDIGEDTDINVLIDDLMAEHGIEAGDAQVHRKVIKLDRKFAHVDGDKPRLGFMASAQDQGWEIIAVVPGSGAAEAGLKKGDLIIDINGQSTKTGGLALTEFIAMDKQQGEVSDVTVIRDGNELVMGVTAKEIDSPDILMTLDGDSKFLSSSGSDFKFVTGDLDGMFEGLHVDVEHLDKMVEGLGDHDIRVVTTGDADAYFFSGSKMNQWLGKKHHFSTITPSLGKYFGTQQGVLVLEVDTNNKLGLQDGDVIIAINDQDVKSPKDVVKTMSSFKNDAKIKIEIIREKETLYLES